jgi:hypothetical protein
MWAKGRTIRKVMGGGGAKPKKRKKIGGKIFPGIVQKNSLAWKIGL